MKQLNNFTKTILDFVIEELKDLKNSDMEVYGCNLAYELTETININGSVHCDRYKAIDFIKENFDEFGELVEHCKNNFGETLNPFNEPEKAEVFAYIEGASSLLSNCDIINDNWNDSITLTNETIDTIIEQLQDSDNISF